jgi:hypothetical protein
MKKFVRTLWNFYWKNFKIYFSNVFSIENDFLDHAACTKFFSHTVQERYDSCQAYPLTIYVVSPLQNHPILQCRSGLPVETRHG